MGLWAFGNLQILGVNIMKYNELLERQKQEEEELVQRMARD